jgi:hypothetical protein
MLVLAADLGVGALLVLWSIVFVRRSLSFKSNRTLLAVLAWQVLLFISGLVWSGQVARPDLIRFPDWIALGVVAFAVPLAVGAVLDWPTGNRRRIGLKVATIGLVVVTLAGSAGVVAAAIAPALSQTTIAGRRIPVNLTTLQNGYSMAVHIPAPSSGFSARDANLWVPPGWILHPDVQRSVVEMMMGQPGDPTLGATLDALHSLGPTALQNAPFILVVDQLGGHHLNPPCRNTSAGKVTTYLSVDVRSWIQRNLPIPAARPYWTIAGFSHGGDCAEFLEASFPSLWANMLSVSGPDTPGTPNIPFAIAHYFGGSQAKFNAALTDTVLRAHGRYTNVVATFATGALDQKYGPGVIKIASIADEEGWHVSTLVVPNAGHVAQTLNDGLMFGYHKLLTAGRFPTNGATPARYLCAAATSPSDCSDDQIAMGAGTIALIDLGLFAVFFVIKIIQYQVGNRRGRKSN